MPFRYTSQRDLVSAFMREVAPAIMKRKSGLPITLPMAMRLSFMWRFEI